MSLVLVVSRPPRPAPALASVLEAVRAPLTRADGDEAPASPPDPADAAAADAATRTDVWRAVRDEVANLRDVPAGAVTPGRLDVLAAAISEDDDDPTVQYAATADEAIEAVRARIDDGAAAVAVVPVGLAVDDAEGSLRDPDLLELHRRLDEVGPRASRTSSSSTSARRSTTHPRWRRPSPRSGRRARRSRRCWRVRSTAPSMATSTGSPGSWPRSRRASRPGTRLVLRGSSVQGASYKTGEPFDGRGPGTSDLDIVLIGDEAMAAWAPEAFYLPG